MNFANNIPRTATFIPNFTYINYYLDSRSVPEHIWELLGKD